MTYAGGKYVREHRHVWQMTNGPIPDGMFIHYIDGDKLNNEISNLELITHTEHMRRHAGYEMLDGTWFKQCNDCKVFYELGDFYASKANGPNALNAYCKRCFNQRGANKRWRTTK